MKNEQIRAGISLRGRVSGNASKYKEKELMKMKIRRKFHTDRMRGGRRPAALLLALALVCLALLPQRAVYAAQGTGGAAVLSEPEIAAQGAVVIDANTKEIIYGKNADKKYYPASITKLMTALLVIENCNLDETVTFSKTATTNLESGAVSLGLVEGDQLTVRQCLYALLLKSANEVGNALAEHVSGSIAAFAELMTRRAAEMGCTNTHFMNPHGLNDPNHYTTPYDMALIASYAFANETLRKIDTTLSYKLPATKTSGARTLSMGHKMLYPTDSRYYEGIIGGKTGYTSLAGNTLVTGAERNGVRLIAVVMKANGTHYTDTKALLDYGFAWRAANPAGVSPAAGSPTAGSPTTGSPAAESPTAENPTTGSPAAGTPVAENPTTGSPTTGTPTMESPAPGASGTNVQPPAVTGTAPAAQTTGWVQDNAGWYYIRSDGSYAAGEWLNLDGVEYWIDSNGYMATGWRLFVNGDWYYFRSSGAMAKNLWATDNGKWFYLGSDGVMMKDTVTPDGYVLGADGAWIEN